MGYCAVGSMSSADWAEIKKLCRQMKKELNEKLETLERQLESEIAALDTGKIQTIINQLNALNIQMQAVISGQAIQDQRLDNLEEKCANVEFTTSEILEAYNGA
jgi:hypothetical protein